MGQGVVCSLARKEAISAARRGSRSAGSSLLQARSQIETTPPRNPYAICSKICDAASDGVIKIEQNSVPLRLAKCPSSGSNVSRNLDGLRLPPFGPQPPGNRSAFLVTLVDGRVFVMHLDM